MEYLIFFSVAFAWIASGILGWWQILKIKGGVESASFVDYCMLPIGLLLGPMTLVINSMNR